MSAVQETRYTCDRCRCEQIEQRDLQPTNWAGIIVRYMDRRGAGELGLMIREGQLCSDCRIAFLTWWNTGRP
jgi:hypothetical protein